MLNLIFDFDGTLVDSFLTAILIFNDYAQKHHLPCIQPSDYEKLRSLSSQQIWQVIGKYRLRLPAIITAVRKQLRSQMATLKFFPGFFEVLAQLPTAHYRLGILTTNSQENVKCYLQANKLDKFHFIYSENNWFGKAKALKKLLKNFSLENDKTFYIGDETRDIQAAKKNNIGSIAVTWGFNNKTILAAENPDFLIDTPRDLLTVLAACDS